MPQIVTKENLKIGRKVIRGPDWYYGDQDIRENGNGIGIIVDGPTSYGCRVRWTGGYIDDYQLNTKNTLYYLEDEFQLNFLIF